MLNSELKRFALYIAKIDAQMPQGITHSARSSQLVGNYNTLLANAPSASVLFYRASDGRLKVTV